MYPKHQQLLNKLAAAERRLARIREGTEELEDVLGVRRWYAKGVSNKAQQFAAKASANFHIPAVRAYRHTNAAGATSFHFSHRFVNRVEHEMCHDGLRPWAARSHAR